MISKLSRDTKHIGKYWWAAPNLKNNFEIISGKFSCDKTKLFQTDVDEGWNNIERLFYFLSFHLLISNKRPDDLLQIACSNIQRYTQTYTTTHITMCSLASSSNSTCWSSAIPLANVLNYYVNVSFSFFNLPVTSPRPPQPISGKFFTHMPLDLDYKVRHLDLWNV